MTAKADDTTITDPAAPAAPVEPKMVTITLDGKSVEVPESAAPILLQTERELKSGLNANHQRRMEELKEREDGFLEDVAFINQHPELLTDQDALERYDFKFKGGTGKYSGDINAVIESIREKEMGGTPVSRTPIELKSTVENEKIIQLETAQREIAKQLDDERANKAMDVMDTLAESKYAYADKDAVLVEMRDYYRSNRKHPTKVQIEEFLKKSDEHVKKIIGTGYVPKPQVRTTGRVDGGIPVSKLGTPPQFTEHNEANIKAYIRKAIDSSG